jgi:hypothetical protein
MEETPFGLDFRSEAVIPTEIVLPSFRAAFFDPERNREGLKINLDLLEERRDQASIRMVAHQERAARYYNAKVQP